MTAEPLTAAEQERVARFDAAPPAEESAVERVARAMWEARTLTGWWAADDHERGYFRRLAEAALAAMRPAPDTAKADEGAAIERVRKLHSPIEWFEEVEPGDEVFDLTRPLGSFCRECTDNEYVEQVEDGYAIDQGSPVVAYPCPTIVALGAAS